SMTSKPGCLRRKATPLGEILSATRIFMGKKDLRKKSPAPASKENVAKAPAAAQFRATSGGNPASQAHPEDGTFAIRRHSTSLDQGQLLPLTRYYACRSRPPAEPRAVRPGPAL